jgi:hypothetical protein
MELNTVSHKAQLKKNSITIKTLHHFLAILIVSIYFLLIASALNIYKIEAYEREAVARSSERNKRLLSFDMTRTALKRLQQFALRVVSGKS